VGQDSEALEARMTTQDAVLARSGYCLKAAHIPARIHYRSARGRPPGSRCRLCLGLSFRNPGQLRLQCGQHRPARNDSSSDGRVHRGGPEAGAPGFKRLIRLRDLRRCIGASAGTLGTAGPCWAPMASGGILSGSIPNSEPAWFRWNLLRGRFVRENGACSTVPACISTGGRMGGTIPRGAENQRRPEFGRTGRPGHTGFGRDQGKTVSGENVLQTARVRKTLLT
jgi:hypothetical protein